MSRMDSMRTHRLFMRTPQVRGFSLIELLTVMAIMAMLTTLAVTSYFGAVRGMTRRSAVKHFADSLVLARQRACMENTSVSVIAFNEISGETDTDVTPSYVLVKELGRLSLIKKVNGIKNLIDEFTEIDKIFGRENLGYTYRGNIRLYNLSKGKWSYVYPWVEQYPFKQETGLKQRRSASGSPFTTVQEKTDRSYTLNAFAFGINSTVNNANSADDDWCIGDAYGIEAAPMASLPRLFQFSLLSTKTDEALVVTFKPDGRLDSNGNIDIIIQETQPPALRSKVTVKVDGTIKFDGKWY